MRKFALAGIAAAGIALALAPAANADMNDALTKFERSVVAEKGESFCEVLQGIPGSGGVKLVMMGAYNVSGKDSESAAKVLYNGLLIYCPDQIDRVNAYVAAN